MRAKKNQSPAPLSDLSKIWMGVIQKTQEEMLACAQKHSHLFTPPPPPVDMEVITQTWAEALPKLLENPAKALDLQTTHLNNVQQLWGNVLDILKGHTPQPLCPVDSKDKRFKNPQWSENPVFFFMQQLYLLNAQLLRQTVDSIEDIPHKTKHKLSFYTNHLIDAMSPTNFPLSNPDVIEKTLETKGENLVQGFRNFLKHRINQEQSIPITDMSAFKIGEDIAATKGSVVFKNDFFELIYYHPTTEKVTQVPLLILPPWINKYYIFDLRPENSFVKWMVDSGIPVFMVSWANPGEKLAQKRFSDFVLEGALEAVEQVISLSHQPSINVMGYCTGGVLLNCLMSYLHSKKQQAKIKSASLVASPVDFQEAGDLLVYVCEQQLQKLENYTAQKGYLDAHKMVQAFNMLRANDLIWSYYVNSYFMGKAPSAFDLLHWNCDAVHMPATMHPEFLRAMYLENKLLQPKGIKVGRTGVDLSRITTPTFMMAAIDDHIAPWRSIFPLLHLRKKGLNKFVLAGSGHVAGVINPPHKNKYHYWSGDFSGEPPMDWLNKAEKIPGSWWNEWRAWLSDFAGDLTTPMRLEKSAIIDEAPGRYVRS